MDPSWISFFSAALTGGISVKIIEIFYQSWKDKTKQKETAKDIVDSHFDPLMKAADEIVGKTRSLAERDFQTLIEENNTNNKSDNYSTELLSLLYLYSQFWGRIEILRQESVGVSISTDGRGAILKDFLACLESQRIRLVDRVHQKAIGELSIYLDNGKYRTIGLVKFSSGLKEKEELNYWIKPLKETLINVENKKIRQKVLVYGVVMHALIDTLDQNHEATHFRPSYPNKLNKQSKRDLQYRVFGVYLKDVKTWRKYLESN